MVTMKVEAVFDQESKDINDLGTILADRKYHYSGVRPYDSKFQFSDEIRKILLMKIFHREYAKGMRMREQYAKHG